jgi:MinD superfamily P-loop ATPase
MKQLTVLSGKGGTGKTTLAASFAVLARDAVVADCDVDAPDLHMLLHPTIVEAQEFRGSKLAVVDKARCVECDLCREKCRFGAITESYKVDHYNCEGCGVCRIVCPTQAITLTERLSGHAYVSKTEYGFMAHAMLRPGEANSGKLVTLVRQNARNLAEKIENDLIIIDGPPGIGCPVIASVTGVDVGIVVTEPTLSGIHDFERALQLLKHFAVPPLVCVNMYDINKENTKRIVSFCEANEIDVVGKIPFNPIVTEAIVEGEPVVKYGSESNVAREIENIWEKTLLALTR